MLTKSPSSPFNRPRWTEQDARAALAALERSGKSVRVFAAEQGLDPQRLYMWRRRLAAQLSQFRRKRPRSEMLRRLEGQLVLPLEGLTVPVAKPKDTTSEDDKKKRRGTHPGRGAPPAHLPRVPVFNRVPPEHRICPQCGSMMTTVGHSSCLLLNVVPARVYVEERLDETVACPKDDTIVSAPPPPQIVEGGKLADGLIVEAVCDKYIEHQPIERQCTRFVRAGVEVAPTWSAIPARMKCRRYADNSCLVKTRLARANPLRPTILREVIDEEGMKDRSEPGRHHDATSGIAVAATLANRLLASRSSSQVIVR